jgi:hypothetical protein
MPRSRLPAAGTKAPQVMTWGRAAPVIVLALIFDALRIFFNFFWFFGPALLAAGCTALARDKVAGIVGAAIGGKVAAGACALGAGALGVFGVEVTAPFGAIMAMAVGILGWMTIGLILALTNSRIYRENAVWFVTSFLVAEVPFVNALPAFTAAVCKMYSHQIKLEKAALKRYEAETRAAQTEQVAAARQRQLQEAEMTQMEAANEAEYEEEQAAAEADAQYEEQKAA